MTDRCAEHGAGAGLASQAGQALIESLVAALALGVLWVAVNWLAHHQDAALSATHASRHQAFLASRGESGLQDAPVLATFFGGRAHRWTDRRGRVLLQDDAPITVSREQIEPLTALAQPGALHAYAAVLRREWDIEDGGMLRAQVGLTLDSRVSPGTQAQASLLGLAIFDLPYPSLKRSISILADAGHAESDVAVQSRVGRSALAWSSAQARSRAVAMQVNLMAAGVDAGWGRAGASLDWLQPWRGEVPPQLLTDYEPVERRN